MPKAAQRVLATFTNLQKLRVNTTQAFLAKSENSIFKRMRETHGYLELVVEVAEKQLSQPSEGCISKVIALLAEEALCITKRWNKLKRKVLWKYLVYILQTTGMPNLRYGPRYNLTRFSSQFNNSNIWFICRDLSG